MDQYVMSGNKFHNFDIRELNFMIFPKLQNHKI